MSRTVVLGAGIVKLVNSSGVVIASGSVESVKLEVQEQASGAALVIAPMLSVVAENYDRLGQAMRETSNAYDRMQQVLHTEQLQRQRKRPAWKSPYGPQRR